MPKLDGEKTEMLIVLVQEYKELYDMSDNNYSNVLRRDNIWSEIGKELKESGKYRNFNKSTKV